MNKRVRNKAFIIMLILLAGTIFSGCGLRYVIGNTRYLRRSEAEEFTIKKEAVEPIKKIDIHTGAAEVELIPSDNYYVEIDYLYWEEEPEYSIDDGTLYFDDSDAFPNSYSINFNLDNRIKIYLPEAASLEDIYIKNSSGDVTISSFVANDLDVTVSYGDFAMKDAAANEADITLSSGTSKITDFQAGDLNYTNSYGNAKFTNINTGAAMLPTDTQYDKVQLTMSSGNVDITGLNSNTLDISNSYGNVNCEGVTAAEFDVSLSSGDLDVSKSDIADADVENSYGDVTLKLKGDEAEYYLDLDTSYGNIKVGNKEYEEHLIVENNGSKKIVASLSSGNVTVKFE